MWLAFQQLWWIWWLEFSETRLIWWNIEHTGARLVVIYDNICIYWVGWHFKTKYKCLDFMSSSGECACSYLFSTYDKICIYWVDWHFQTKYKCVFNLCPFQVSVLVRWRSSNVGIDGIKDKCIESNPYSNKCLLTPHPNLSYLSCDGIRTLLMKVSTVST